MAFNKPNDPSAGVNPAGNAIQAQLDSNDLAILAAGANKTGVLSGCGVVQHAGTPAMNVDVAAGVVSVEGTLATVTAVTKTISANATGSPRLDLICVSSAGTVSVVNGTAATVPDYPAITVDSDGNLLRAVLAVVYVPTGATSILTTNISDLRVFVNFGALLDTATLNADVGDPGHFSWLLTDNTTYAHNQTGSNGAQRIVAAPTLGTSKTVPVYSGLTVTGTPTIGASSVISQHNGVNVAIAAGAGITTPLQVGVLSALSAAGATVTKQYGLQVTTAPGSGGRVTTATGFYYMLSSADKTFGLKVGGVDGDYSDHWPSYHMGPLAMGGTPTAGTDGGIFNPAAMIEIRELKQLVYTIAISTTSGSPTITVDATATIPTFDFLFDSGAAITGTNIPGGTTISNSNPTTATMSANATGTGTVTATITKVLTDQNASGIRMLPAYDGAGTVVRHNYLRFNRPTLTNSAAVTDAAAMHFPAGFGTHEALGGSATKSTPSAVDGFVKINVSGTIYYIPAYASKTA